MEGPIAPGERVAEIDYVRGFALLGIFIMNMPIFNFSIWAFDTTTAFPGAWDRAIEAMRDVLIAGKFNAMFSLLFAVGFTILMERLKATRPDAAMRIYLRRIGILFVLGLIHGLVFWPGDILHIYAVLGLLLLLLQRVPNRWIVVLIVLSIVAPTISRWINEYLQDPAVTKSMMDRAEREILLDNAAFTNGSLAAQLQQTRTAFLMLYVGPWSVHNCVVLYSEILTTMLLGLLAGRGRWFQKAGAYPQIVNRIQWCALGAGIATGLLLYYARAQMDARSAMGITYLYGYSYRLSRAALMVFYVTSLLRIIRVVPWRNRLSPIAFAGRMPLTNYLLQTALALWIFRPWGLGLYGRVGPLGSLLIAIGIYVLVQLPLSTFWFKRFRFGPLEYLWRAATYGRWPSRLLN